LLAVLGVLVLAGTAARGQTGGESGVGYIDSAMIANTFRFRYDATFDDNRVYRAEFIYPKPSAFRFAPPPFTDPHARGGQPDEILRRLDTQEFSGYLELAATDWLSGFIEVPQRLLHESGTGPAENHTGIGDINAGARLGVVHEDEYGITLQLRTYAPTGFVGENLGNGHVSLEPAVLWYAQPTERLLFEGELRDWIPVGGSDFAGDILRYGIGASYNVSCTPRVFVRPVVELVGWTVLSGKDLNPLAFPVPQNAAGQTIVNLKTGIRVGFGSAQGQDEEQEQGQKWGWLRGSDLYVGFGRALTGDVWYKDIVRAEYRLHF
jgi:hypothetical protein